MYVCLFASTQYSFFLIVPFLYGELRIIAACGSFGLSHCGIAKTAVAKEIIIRIKLITFFNLLIITSGGS